MICKHCGTVFTGRECPRCGLRVCLENRSHELDLLLESHTQQPKSQSTKRYHSYSSPKKADHIVTGDNSTQDSIACINNDHFKSTRIWLILSIVCLFVAALSGMVGYNTGFKSGCEKSKNNAYSEDVRSEFDEKREENLDDDVELNQEKIGNGLSENAYSSDSAYTDFVIPKMASFESRVDMLLYADVEKVAEGCDGIKWIQYALREIRIAEIDPDGIFGSETQAALKKFQQAMNVKPTDNVIDGNTVFLLYYAMNHPEIMENATQSPKEP